MFKEKLDNIDWESVMTSQDPSHAFHTFHNLFTDVFKSSFPLKKIKKGYSTKKPWITFGLRKSIKRKKISLFKNAQTS